MLVRMGLTELLFRRVATDVELHQNNFPSHPHLKDELHQQRLPPPQQQQLPPLQQQQQEEQQQECIIIRRGEECMFHLHLPSLKNQLLLLNVFG